jgi:antitoxin HicB
MAEHASYSVVIVPVPEKDGGGYLAMVPELNGCMADGETREEAVSEVASAILEWIDEAQALGRDVPVPGDLAKHHRAAAKEQREATERVIKTQEQLIKYLRKELDKATREIGMLSTQSKVQFGWDIEYVDPVTFPKGQYAIA